MDTCQLTNINYYSVKKHSYAPPVCEYEKFELGALLAQSDLTDDGAGDILTPGDIYEL